MWYIVGSKQWWKLLCPHSIWFEEVMVCYLYKRSSLDLTVLDNFHPVSHFPFLGKMAGSNWNGPEGSRLYEFFPVGFRVVIVLKQCLSLLWMASESLEWKWCIYPSFPGCPRLLAYGCLRAWIATIPTHVPVYEAAGEVIFQHGVRYHHDPGSDKGHSFFSHFHVFR